MAEPDRPDTELNLGVFDQPRGPVISATEIAALVLSLIWLGGVLYFLFFIPDDPEAAVGPTDRLMSALAIVLPIGMIWIAAVTARTSRQMRAEALRMQSSLNAMRKAYVEQQQTAGMEVHPAVEAKLEEIAEVQKQTESAIATFTSIRPERSSADVAALPASVALTTATSDGQPSLALGTPAEALQEPISVEDFISAINFPENENDKEGFRTLRRALEDRGTAQLIRAAQDVLTLLSQEGIYMDDLRPDRAKPEVWRRFAQGERGRSVAALAGIRDRSSLALAAGRMKSDPVFRDSVHHFLRQFDRTFVEFEKNATDQDLNDMAETRTARAFMLLGRVSGTFD